nr:uncharacterized protein LOC104266405 [Ciona intestinalis]|eukprot:XP_009860819.2 uncharacterized protein LOC104266405 [Ciona intestinalis]
MDALKVGRYKINKSYIYVALVCFIALSFYLDYIVLFDPNATKKQLQYHYEANRVTCFGKTQERNRLIGDKTSRTKLLSYLKRPTCNNLLRNISLGNWVLRKPIDFALRQELDSIHDNYRKEVGIPVQPWRSDGRCGYKVMGTAGKKNWPRVASFCDPKSNRQCCTDWNSGVCVAISTTQQCNCLGCVNTEKYYTDALESTWVTNDNRCKWVNYTQLEACAVLNELSDQQHMAELYFVGDSLMRNMFMGFALLLSGELKRGLWKTCLSKELNQTCQGDNQFVLRRCHSIAVAHSLDEMGHNNGILCGGHRYFNVWYKDYGMPSQSQDFIKFVQEISGKPNTYVVLGVGLHFQLQSDKTIQSFLDPVFKMLGEAKQVWPKIIWVHALSIGLLKPPTYHKLQGTNAITRFVAEIESYLKLHQVPSLDFRSITAEVRSYDGTHYGSGVNIMKAQILLNYLSTLSLHT